ncbi:histidine--tRNA ligase [Amphibiibacter pelophylacis]|uniref:Histidine--tRNA ligase n=1 Tax=Amphibiibacter pelophylacis TaxID=1799477 RepID=A0ACC6NZ42_9BURK
MADLLRAVKGMNDLFPGLAVPDDSQHWAWLERQLHEVLGRYGYGPVRTPVVEPTALFVRGLGEVTDVVEKEMYAFEDSLNGDRLALRPENTAGVMRAALQHHLLREGGRRLYYIGPMFRHERPQKGRYRQFHQAGAEVLGYAGPDVDVELIALTRALWQRLGLRCGGESPDVRLEINSLGQADERQAHRAALIAYFEAHADQLDETAQSRLYTNPLRVLDTKNPAMQALVEAAPRLIDFLGEASLAHFAQMQALLDALGIAYTVNPRLVRGLDYYNLTVFEWVTDRLGSQGTVCAGGRYDGLAVQLGAKAPVPAVGWAMGLERLLLLLAELNLLPAASAPDAYAIVSDARHLGAVLPVLESLRAHGASVVLHPGQGSLKAQFRKADASQARWALVFADDEVAAGEVGLKPLRSSDGASSHEAAQPAQQRLSVACEADLAELARRLRA